MISLASGGVESSANVQLRPVTAVHVSGVLTSPNGPLGRTAIVLERPGLDAIAGLQGRYEIATTLSDADGRFRFLGVPPGQYTVRVLSAPVVGPAQATMMTVQTPDGSSLARGIMLGDSTTPNAPTWWATEKISVGAKDIDGFAINVRAGFRVRGHVVFEGQTAHPPLQRLAPELESRDLRASLAVPTMPIDASGNFVSFETPPGSYLFTMAMPSGWFVKSAIANGRDLSDLPFDLNSDVNDLVVTLADRPATASGVVTGVDGRPDATASVVAFPVDSRYWVDFGAQARRIRDVRTDRHGRFSITGVPSGDYLIVAIPSASLDWTMPKFFETLSRLATRTTLVEGEEKTVTLRTTEVRK